MKELEFTHQTKEESDKEFDAFINEMNNPTRNKPELMDIKHIDPKAKGSYYEFSDMHNEYVYTLTKGAMQEYNYNFEESDSQILRTSLAKYGNPKIHTVSR